MSDRGRPPRRTRRWWRETATVLGLAGLLVTLFFNTLAARQSAGDDREQREAVQVGLITDLNARAIEAERLIDDSELPDVRCDDAPLSGLSRHNEAVLRVALGHYDYLAWLFNTGTLTMDQAKRYLARRLTSGWSVAQDFYGREQARDEWRDLATFATATLDGRGPPEDCSL